MSCEAPDGEADGEALGIVLAGSDGARRVVSAGDGMDVAVADVVVAVVALAVVALRVEDSDGEAEGEGELLRLGDVVVPGSPGLRDRVGLGSDSVRDGREVAVTEAVGAGRPPVSSPPHEASDRTSRRPRQEVRHARPPVVPAGPVSTMKFPVRLRRERPADPSDDAPPGGRDERPSPRTITQPGR